MHPRLHSSPFFHSVEEAGENLINEGNLPAVTATPARFFSSKFLINVFCNLLKVPKRLPSNEYCNEHAEPHWFVCLELFKFLIFCGRTDGNVCPQIKYC